MPGILVITTGGTIGALPVENVQKPPRLSVMPKDGRDRVGEALASDFARFETRCVSLEPRDSRFIDDAYRLTLAALIENSAEERVLVTHGTDTLLDTAGFLYHQATDYFRLSNKLIILTGAMTPLSNGTSSDGYRNIDFSLNYLSNAAFHAPQIGVVLCGFDSPETTAGQWLPRYYAYEPDRYEKYFDPEDARLSRLKFRRR